MLYRELPKTKEKLSILGFGCMRLPLKGANINEEETIKQIRYAADKGINYFDTAWPYHGGKSEVVLGKALENGYRDKVKIADKLPHWLCKKEDDLDYYFNEQLKRLNMSKIDYYLIHNLDYESWTKIKNLGARSFFDRLKKEKKIDNAGFSFHGHRADFKKIIDEYDWDFCQIQFNILDEHNQAGLEGLEYAASKNIGVIIMEPLRGGILAGNLPGDVQEVYNSSSVKRTNVEWALRWIWNHSGVVTVLSGMNDMKQIDENIIIAEQGEKNSLSEEDVKIVKKASDAFLKLMKIPCTGCQYCMPCPKNINIPSSFSFYNNKYLFKKGFISRMYYLIQHAEVQNRKPQLASQCVECGKCLEHCPQNIDIPLELKKVKREFEGITTKPLLWLMKRLVASMGKKEK